MSTLMSQSRPQPSLGMQYYDDMVPERESKELFLWGLLAHIGRPGSYLEIGCQDGWMVRTMRQIGARPSLGIEFDPNARKYARRYANILVSLDQREPLQLRNRFGLVMCIGADQRVGGTSIDWLLDSLVGHVINWLVIAPRTALPWDDELMHRGVVLDQSMTLAVRTTLRRTLPGTYTAWLADAVRVYCRG